MAIKPELQEIYFDNIRTNQIGETDGVSPEVAADIGYHTLEQLAELSPLPVASAEVQESDASVKGAERAKATVCGDCGASGGCAHMGYRRNGKGYTKGY